MKRVCKYIVVSNNTLIGLEYLVNTYISEGWEPQGGIATNVTPYGAMYYQALIKVKDNDGND